MSKFCPVSIGLVDDDPLLLELLAEALRREGLVVSWTASGDCALECISECLPDVIGVDIRMPGIGGFELTKEILASFPGAVVVMLTSLEDSGSLSKAWTAGAIGYLVKTDSPDRVAAGFRTAAAGLKFVSPSLQIQGACGCNAPGPVAPNPLTSRETEVLELVARSLTNDQIARRLKISVETVKRHVSSILAKLKVPDRLGAVMWGVHNGVVRSPPGK